MNARYQCAVYLAMFLCMFQVSSNGILQDTKQGLLNGKALQVDTHALNTLNSKNRSVTPASQIDVPKDASHTKADILSSDTKTADSAIDAEAAKKRDTVPAVLDNKLSIATSPVSIRDGANLKHLNTGSLSSSNVAASTVDTNLKIKENTKDNVKSSAISHADVSNIKDSKDGSDDEKNELNSDTVSDQPIIGQRTKALRPDGTLDDANPVRTDLDSNEVLIGVQKSDSNTRRSRYDLTSKLDAQATNSTQKSSEKLSSLTSNSSVQPPECDTVCELYLQCRENKTILPLPTHNRSLQSTLYTQSTPTQTKSVNVSKTVKPDTPSSLQIVEVSKDKKTTTSQTSQTLYDSCLKAVLAAGKTEQQCLNYADKMFHSEVSETLCLPKTIKKDDTIKVKQVKEQIPKTPEPSHPAPPPAAPPAAPPAPPPAPPPTPNPPLAPAQTSLDEVETQEAQALKAQHISGKSSTSFTFMASTIGVAGIVAIIVVAVYVKHKHHGSFAIESIGHRSQKSEESVYNDPLETRFSSIVMITPNGNGICVL